MPKRKRISVEKQVQYCLDRAVVEMKKRKRRRSGFDLFKIDWFKKNQGYKAIDKHTSSLISSEWKVLSSAERNEYAEKVKNLPSSNQTLTKKILLPDNSHLYQERNKIANELNSICNQMSMELGLE